MPTITTQLRGSIGNTEGESRPHRATVTAATGMNLPAKAPEPTTPPVDAKTGQPGITEDTATKAVTLSPQLTALARRQQKLQQEIQAQRDKEASWATEKANYVPKTELKAKLQENAAQALAEMGTTYEEITELLLAQQQGDDPVKSLRKDFDQLKQSQEEQITKQYESTLKQYRAEADQLVSSDLKAFHLINKGKHQDAVVQHIVDTWKESPDQVLTVAQAAKEVEEILRENAKEAAEALKELEEPVAETAAPTQKTLPPPQKTAALRTLTNSVDATPTRVQGQFQHLSMKERIAQAIARAQR